MGIYEGKGIRKALERMGPAGLTHGVLNDRLQFDTVVSFEPGRREAHVRGLEMGMLGETEKGVGYWEVSVYDNRFVKEDGIWKVREMRVFPLFRSDYSKGWGKRPHHRGGAEPARWRRTSRCLRRTPASRTGWFPTFVSVPSR